MNDFTIYAVMVQHYGENHSSVEELFFHKITAEVYLRQLREKCHEEEMECNSIGCTSYFIREMEVHTSLMGV